MLRKLPKIHLLALLVLTLGACSDQKGSQAVETQTESSEPKIIPKPSAYAYSDILSEDFYKMTREEGQKWQSYFDLLEYQKVLVLSDLNSEEDYLRHAEYLDKYISASSDYLDFLTNLHTKATKKFTAYGIPEEQVTPVLDHLLSTYDKQKGTLTSLLGAHIDYGRKMQSLLQFLKTNQQEWQLVNDQIDMENKELAAQYNAHIDEIVAVEDLIEQYSKQLDFHLKK